jgi:hypothetical protein
MKGPATALSKRTVWRIASQGPMLHADLGGDVLRHFKQIADLKDYRSSAVLK